MVQIGLEGKALRTNRVLPGERAILHDVIFDLRVLAMVKSLVVGDGAADVDDRSPEGHAGRPVDDVGGPGAIRNVLVRILLSAGRDQHWTVLWDGGRRRFFVVSIIQS